MSSARSSDFVDGFHPHADAETSYASQIKAQGGKVAIVDIDCSVRGEDADWLFEGDAARVLYLSTLPSSL
jgi:hypothetical protein